MTPQKNQVLKEKTGLIKLSITLLFQEKTTTKKANNKQIPPIEVKVRKN